MRFLNFFHPFNRWQPNQLLIRKTPFAVPPSRTFKKPVLGTVDLLEGHAPLVRYAGTLWRCRLKSSRFESLPLTHGQLVKITGRQSNCLLIEIEPEENHDENGE
jgi:hypothetical protein